MPLARALPVLTLECVNRQSKDDDPREPPPPVPGWYGRQTVSRSGRGQYGQQGQGRFEELEDRGEQVAEGEASGEEGEGRPFRLLRSLDRQVAAGAATGSGHRSASPRRR